MLMQAIKDITSVTHAAFESSSLCTTLNEERAPAMAKMCRYPIQMG
jgi:hypothetical protein